MIRIFNRKEKEQPRYTFESLGLKLDKRLVINGACPTPGYDMSLINQGYRLDIRADRIGSAFNSPWTCTINLTSPKGKSLVHTLAPINKGNSLTIETKTCIGMLSVIEKIDKKYKTEFHSTITKNHSQKKLANY